MVKQYRKVEQTQGLNARVVRIEDSRTDEAIAVAAPMHNPTVYPEGFKRFQGLQKSEIFFGKGTFYLLCCFLSLKTLTR